MGAPKYAMDPTKRFIEYVEATISLLELSERGISMIRAAPQIVEAIAAAERDNADWDEEAHTAKLEDTKRLADLAIKECDSGFPLLHEYALVGIWGAFEAAIDDVVVGILSHEPEALRVDPFTKIRIPLADFENLEKEDRIRIVLRELQRNLRADQRLGVTRFEAILDSLKLSGSVPDKTREDIWLMHNTRNIIVHCRSCADRAFVVACPTLGLKIGDRVAMNHEIFGEYTNSLNKYVTEIICRIGTRYGADMSGSRAKLVSSA